MIKTSIILRILVLLRTSNTAFSSLSPFFFVKISNQIGVCHSIENIEKCCII